MYVTGRRAIEGIPKSIGAHLLTSCSLDAKHGDTASDVCSWRFQSCFVLISLHFRMGMLASFVHHCVLELRKFFYDIGTHRSAPCWGWRDGLSS